MNMHRNRRPFVAATAAALAALLPALAVPAAPQPDADTGGTSALALGARIGTAGAGGQLTIGLAERLNLRLIGQLGSFTYDNEVDDADYEVDFSFGNAGAVLDFHPTGGEFRFSAGLFYNGNELSGDAVPTDDIMIGDYEFPPVVVGTLHAEVDFPSTAGYVGIGWGNAVRGDRRWTVSFDLGVLFYATPEFSLTADGLGAGNPYFEAELQKEEEDIEDDFIANAKFWPVLALGIDVRF